MPWLCTQIIFPHHRLHLHPSSNYRYGIYLLPQLSPNGLVWLLISAEAILKTRDGKMKKCMQKKEAFTLNWCHLKCGPTAAAAHGKLLEAQIQGPGPCLPKSESLGWSSGSCVLIDAAGIAYAH